MYPYGKASQKHLDTCHRDIVTIWTVVAEKYNNSVICGFRNKVDQNEAFNLGYSGVKWPNGKHNSTPSMAVDSAPYFVELRSIDWNDIPAICFFAGKVKAIADELLDLGLIDHKLIWGGDWDDDSRTTDHKLQDYVHFELRAV